MSQDIPSPEPPPEDNPLLPAIQAIEAEKYARAREILTNLLQTNQQNADYWVWLSAAMETQKERLYCLQTAYKIDPNNTAARRGLVLLGALTQEEPAPPFPMNHPKPWDVKIKSSSRQNTASKMTAQPGFRLGIGIGLGLMVLIGVLMGWSLITRKTAAPLPPTIVPSPRPTVTPYATNSAQEVPEVSTEIPLAELLSTPYTPTPIYAATPHNNAAKDSYQAAIHAYKNGEWQLMGSMMAQVATAQPGSVDTLYFIAESDRLSGNYQDAINAYKIAITLNSKYAPSYLGRALANMALSPTKNVLDDLNMAIKMDPNYAEAYMQRGLYYLNKKDFKSAQNDLEQAISLNDSPLAEINLARVLLAQGETEAAVIAAQKANQQDVTMLDGYLVLGMAYRANGQIDQAVAVVETYLKYSPNNAEGYALLGAAYYNRNDYSTAETDLQKAVRLDSSNADGFFWLGQTEMALKKYDDALVAALKARDLNPNSFDVAESLAKVYMARAEYNNSYISIIKVEKLADTPAERARFLYIRAQSLDQLNSLDAAYRDWSEILTLPLSAVTSEMHQQAQTRLIQIYSPTPSPTITATSTPISTLKPTSTIKPLPTSTIKPVATLMPTSTLKPSTKTGTPQPSITPTPFDLYYPTSTPGNYVYATPTP